MQIHRLDAHAALQSLRSSDDGLSADEARRRLREFGPNAVRSPRPVPWALRLARHFTHFFALLLWLAALLAFIADSYAPGQGMRLLGVAILGVILINGLFSWWQEHRTQRTLAALQRLLPHEVKVRRGGELLTLPATVVTGLFTHWLNFSGGADQTVRLEKALSYAVMFIAATAFLWRWLDPRVLIDLSGVNLIYFFLVLSLTPLVTANGYFGGMVTFPLEEEVLPPGESPKDRMRKS